MATVEYRNPASSWMFFLGILFLLVGIYGAVRMVHVISRGVPYPIRGVYPNNIILPGSGAYTGIREYDCNAYPQVYYDFDASGKQTPREATQEEIKLQEDLTKRCIEGFNEDRAKQMQYDRNQTAFLIFVGLGLVVFRRFLKD